MSGTVRGAAFGADPFKAKLGETKLLNSSRANFETQMKKETPDAAKPPAAPSAGRVQWQQARPNSNALPAGQQVGNAGWKAGYQVKDADNFQGNPFAEDTDNFKGDPFAAGASTAGGSTGTTPVGA